MGVAASRAKLVIASGVRVRAVKSEGIDFARAFKTHVFEAETSAVERSAFPRLAPGNSCLDRCSAKVIQP
jgi:hypothetical protein